MRLWFTLTICLATSCLYADSQPPFQIGEQKLDENFRQIYIQFTDHAHTGTDGTVLVGSNPVNLADEGSFVGKASSVNCVGAGIVCSNEGNGILRITVAGGGGGGSSALFYYDGTQFISVSTLSLPNVPSASLNGMTTFYLEAGTYTWMGSPTFISSVTIPGGQGTFFTVRLGTSLFQVISSSDIFMQTGAVVYASTSNGVNGHYGYGFRASTGVGIYASGSIPATLNIRAGSVAQNLFTTFQFGLGGLLMSDSGFSVFSAPNRTRANTAYGFTNSPSAGLYYDSNDAVTFLVGDNVIGGNANPSFTGGLRIEGNVNPGNVAIGGNRPAESSLHVSTNQPNQSILIVSSEAPKFVVRGTSTAVYNNFFLGNSMVQTVQSTTSEAMDSITQRTITAVDEGGASAANVTQLNFVGAGVSYAQVGGTGTATISGGAGGNTTWYYVSKATEILDFQNRYAITGSTGIRVGDVEYTLYMTTITNAFDNLRASATILSQSTSTLLALLKSTAANLASNTTLINDTGNPVDWGKLKNVTLWVAGQDDINLQNEYGITNTTGIRTGVLVVSSSNAPPKFPLITVTTVPANGKALLRVDTSSVSYTGKKFSVSHPRMGVDGAGQTASVRFGMNDDEDGLNEFQIGGTVQLPLTFYDNSIRVLNVGTGGDLNMPGANSKFVIGDEVGAPESKFRVQNGSITSAGTDAGLSIGTNKFNVHTENNGVSIGTNTVTGASFHLNMEVATPEFLVTKGTVTLFMLTPTDIILGSFLDNITMEDYVVTIPSGPPDGNHAFTQNGGIGEWLPYNPPEFAEFRVWQTTRPDNAVTSMTISNVPSCSRLHVVFHSSGMDAANQIIGVVLNGNTTGYAVKLTSQTNAANVTLSTGSQGSGLNLNPGMYPFPGKGLGVGFPIDLNMNISNTNQSTKQGHFEFSAMPNKFNAPFNAVIGFGGASTFGDFGYYGDSNLITSVSVQTGYGGTANFLFPSYLTVSCSQY